VRLPPASSTTRVRPFSGAGLSSYQIDMIREKVRDEMTMSGIQKCGYCEKGVHHETQTDDCECGCHVDRQQELRRAA
jgi:hypothetical protein